MKKAILLVVGLVAGATAAVHKVEITPLHFLKAAKKAPLEFIKGHVGAPRLQGTVSWAICDQGDGDGTFKPDFTQTHSDPLLPNKGDNVTLDLAGTFTDDAEVDGINVYVTWNKNPLYTNDFPRKVQESAGDPFQDKITWLIPSFAPSG